MRSKDVYKRNVGDFLKVSDARKMLDDLQDLYNQDEKLRNEVNGLLGYFGQTETHNQVPIGLVDGNNQDYTLDYEPLDPGRAIIEIDGGVMEYITDYTIDGINLHFTFAPAPNSELNAKFVYWREVDITPQPFGGELIGNVDDNPENIYYLPRIPQDINSLIVIIDGNELRKDIDYFYNGEQYVTLTFSPARGSELYFYADYFHWASPFTIPVHERPPETPGPGITTFSLEYLPKYSSGVLVKLDGRFTYRSEEFRVEGKKIIFYTAPAANTLIDVYYNTSISGELAMTRVKFQQLLDKFALHPFLLMGG